MATANELNLLRNALSQDCILYTVHRNTTPSSEIIRVDCFASKEAGSPGLIRITGLVARALKRRCSIRGLAMNNREDVSRNLVAELSKKLELDLKHERIC